MKNVLQVEYPPITSYPSLANILSMVWSSKKNAQIWFFDHLIQIVFRSNHKYTLLDYYDQADLDNYFSIIYGMPNIGWMRGNSETTQFEKFTDYIEHQIDQSYGLEACLDRYYLESLNQNPREHFIHSSFIYGYDSEKKEVYVCDFWETGKYASRTFSYDEINNSMNNDGIINHFKAYDSDYKINFELMKRSLEDYLYSRDSMFRFQSSNREYNQDAIFGLECYNHLFHGFDKYGTLDTRSFHVIMDHKVMMKYRLEYLFKTGIISADSYSKLNEMNETLIKRATVLRSMVLMLNVCKSKMDISKIESGVKELRDLDEIFMKSLLECL